MTEAQLPQSVVNRDRQLASAADSTALTLAQLRWEWTLNPRNPNRVSMREYGRQVGRHNKQVSVYARAYALVLADPSLPISEAVDRSRLGEDTYAAAEAIASVRGISVASVRTRYPNEMRQVRDEARSLAELKGTSVADEVDAVARRVVEASERERRLREEHVSRTALRSDVASSRLVAARRSVLDAIEQLHDVELTEDDVTLLDDRLDKLEAAVRLLRARVRGESGVDWDTELRNMQEVG